MFSQKVLKNGQCPCRRKYPLLLEIMYTNFFLKQSNIPVLVINSLAPKGGQYDPSIPTSPYQRYCGFDDIIG